MITFADKHTAPLVRQMWKTCFEDSDEFMDIYFSWKYKDENTLIYLENGIVAASLQMLPYSISFYGKVIPFMYLSGLCTLPLYRKKGYMEQLIHRSHDVMKERNISLAVLIPGEDWLYGFYEKYGYSQVFEKDDNPIPLKELITENSDIDKAYEAFDKLYNTSDFCIRKTKADFETIVEDYKIEDCTTIKTNLSGMARVIDAFALLSLYAENNVEKAFALKLEQNVYSVGNGKVEISQDAPYDIEVDIALLCRLLFGFKIHELDPVYQLYFSEHNPVMNLMLE